MKEEITVYNFPYVIYGELVIPSTPKKSEKVGNLAISQSLFSGAVPVKR